MRIRTLLLIKVIGICDLCSINSPELYFEVIGLRVSAHGPPRLYFESLQLPNFDFTADPDPP